MVLEGKGRSVQEALVDVLVRRVVEEAPLRRGSPDRVAKVGGVAGKRPDHNLEAMMGGEAKVVGVGEGPRKGQGVGTTTRTLEATLNDDYKAVDAIVDEEVETRRRRGVGKGGSGSGAVRLGLE